MIISYDTRLAPGYSALPSTKLGKNSITIPIRGTTFRLDYNQVQIFNHSDGIEIMECGQKNLEGLWTILTKDGILSKKIYNELCQFQNLVTSSGFMGNLGTINSTSSVNSANKYNRKVIKLKRQASNVYTIPCKVNGLSLNFIFDLSIQFSICRGFHPCRFLKGMCEMFRIVISYLLADLCYWKIGFPKEQLGLFHSHVDQIFGKTFSFCLLE